MKQTGLSLIEVLLMLTVIAIFITVGIQYDTRKVERLKIDKTVLQTQAILDAGIWYYITNGSWPNSSSSSCSPMALDGTAVTSFFGTSGSYLQNQGLFGGNNFVIFKALRTQFASTLTTTAKYYLHLSSTSTCTGVPKGTFGVIIYFTSQSSGGTAKEVAMAKAIAAKLPHAALKGNGNGTYIATYIYPPGQDPDQAAGLNFAGIYHHGACVPVPACPATTSGKTYSAQVFLTPTSVSGVNDDASTNVYPISSFIAYAEGPSSSPAGCVGASTIKGCSNGTETGQYWRACLQIVTERGDVAVTRTDDWGDAVSIAAFTRCTISSEPTGTDYSGAAGIGYGD